MCRSIIGTAAHRFPIFLRQRFTDAVHVSQVFDSGMRVPIEHRLVAVLRLMLVLRSAERHGHRKPNVDGHTLHDRIEAIAIVRRVVHGPFEAVRVDQLVLAADDVAVVRLLVRLNVSGVGIVHSIGEVVGSGMYGSTGEECHHRNACYLKAMWMNRQAIS